MQLLSTNLQQFIFGKEQALTLNGLHSPSQARLHQTLR